MFGFGALYGDGFLQDEAGTEVFGADVLVGGEGFRSALLEDCALVKQVGAVRDRQSLTHIVVGDDDTDVLVLQFRDDELDVLHGYRIHTGANGVHPTG